MTALRSATAGLLVVAAALTLTACGGTDPDTGQVAAGDPSPPSATPSPSQQGTPSPTAPAPSPAPDPTQEDPMRIDITIGDQRFQATLDDSAASRDLAGQLPVTVEMSDHGGVEKTGRLPSSLSLEGQPAGADPDIGDVGYYAPGNDLVLYYGDQSYYPGIVVLGRLDGDAAERIASIEGSLTATVEAAD